MYAEGRKLEAELAEKTELSRAQSVARQQERYAKVAELITSTPTAILLDLLARDIGGEQYRKIRAELEKRRGKGEAT